MCHSDCRAMYTEISVPLPDYKGLDGFSAVEAQYGLALNKSDMT